MTENTVQIRNSARFSAMRSSVSKLHAPGDKSGMMLSLVRMWRRASSLARVVTRPLVRIWRRLYHLAQAVVYRLGLWNLFRWGWRAINWLYRQLRRGTRGLIRWVWRAIYWVGWRFYRILYQQRRFIMPSASKLGDMTWALMTSRMADRILYFVVNEPDNIPNSLKRILYFLLEQQLLFAMSVNLASRQSERAYHIARITNLIFAVKIKSGESPLRTIYLTTLLRCAQYHRVARCVPGKELIGSANLNHIIGTGHLYDLNVPLAKYYFQRALKVQPVRRAGYMSHRMLGRVFLLEDDLNRAKRQFTKSVKFMPKTVMAHQNYAGRYQVESYRPRKWELREAGKLLVYDNYGQLAEDLFLQGKFGDSFRIYQRMLDYQKKIARPLPRKLITLLARAHPRFDRNLPVRLLPYEWVVQFGHIGLLDSYQKMAQLGMYPKANYVVLAPKGKVISEAYLRYWEKYFIIVRQKYLIDELFPYQRYCGDSFQAYPGENGVAEHWTNAAARAQAEWAKQNREPLLQLSHRDKTFGQKQLSKLGIPEGAWYVGLHIREGGYYGESPDGMSNHRNAELNDYLPAIREITSRGGWVIRLGDPSMRPMPELPQVVDCARSSYKSPRFDIFLLATSRFVIGTTSGLTTACLSFGTPMVLANCISNDWQLWTEGTDFIPKPIWNRREHRYLSFRSAYQQPVQGYLINSAVMARHGYEAAANSAEDIVEAVRYKLDLLDGAASRPHPDDPIMKAYRNALKENPYMFGAAWPVPGFLRNHPELVETPETQKLEALA